MVYNAKIGRQFNKIVVQSVNHELSDMEKRAVFDNPFGYYEPVSPYRIKYKRTQVGDAQIVNIPGDLGDKINEMKNAADAITGAAQQMGGIVSTHLLIRMQRLSMILLTCKTMWKNKV